MINTVDQAGHTDPTGVSMCQISGSDRYHPRKHALDHADASNIFGETIYIMQTL